MLLFLSGFSSVFLVFPITLHVANVIINLKILTSKSPLVLVLMKKKRLSYVLKGFAFLDNKKACTCTCVFSLCHQLSGSYRFLQ